MFFICDLRLVVNNLVFNRVLLMSVRLIENIRFKLYLRCFFINYLFELIDRWCIKKKYCFCLLLLGVIEKYFLDKFVFLR